MNSLAIGCRDKMEGGLIDRVTLWNPRGITLMFPFMLLIILAGCSGGGGGTGGPTISLAWDAPTTNVDGSPLTDLAGYKVYVGTATGVYGNSIDVGTAIQSGNTVTYSLSGLTPGQTYYIAVTAYDIENNESTYSNEVTGTPR